MKSPDFEACRLFPSKRPLARLVVSLESGGYLGVRRMLGVPGKASVSKGGHKPRCVRRKRWPLTGDVALSNLTFGGLGGGPIKRPMKPTGPGSWAAEPTKSGVRLEGGQPPGCALAGPG